MFKLIVFFVFCINVYAEDSVYVINARKGLHMVSDKFLSFNIDPGVLFSENINNKSHSYSFVKYLSPSYVLFSGPSTKFITFSDKEATYRSSGISHFIRKFEINPSTWKKFNRWITNAGFTPIFSLNDNERSGGFWSAKNYLPLFNLTDKLNISCIWQIESENTNKSIHDYVQDYSVLRRTISTFPNSKKNWKIAANNFENYLHYDSVENVHKFLYEILSVSDVGIKQTNDSRNNDQFLLETFSKIRSPLTSSEVYPIWNVYLNKRISENFASAITLANEAGNAAKMGYEVLFSQINFNEKISDTPIFWFSFLHKHLMGRNVLEVKYPHSISGVFTYTHCTKLKNTFTNAGSITILAINNKTEEQHISLKILGSTNFRPTEVEYYVLSTSNETTRETLFNGNKLLFNTINNGKFPLFPVIKQVLTFRNVDLNLPPKSIGFYVFPQARATYCSHEEPYSEEKSITIEFNGNHQTMKLEKALKNKDELKNKNVTEQKNVTKTNSSTTNHVNSTTQLNGIEIELSNAEINFIIKERAKNNAQKKGLNIQAEKLDKMVNFITENFKTADNTIILQPIKHDKAARSKRETKEKFETTKKRDINMELLRKKTKDPDSNRNKEIFDENYEEESSSKRFPYQKKIYVEFEGAFDTDKDQKKYDLFKQKFISESNGKRTFEHKPNPKSPVYITPAMARRKIVEKPGNNRERNFESLEVEDSSEEFFGFFDNTQPRSHFRGATFQELEEFNSSPETRGFIRKSDDLEISFSDEITHGFNRKGSKAKTASKIREYYKNIEELRQSKIFGRSQVNSVEDCSISDYDFFKRYKRDLTEYTEEDIQKYIQFMKEQLKHMRVMQKQAKLRKQTSNVKNLSNNNIRKSSFNLTTDHNDILSSKNKRHHQHFEPEDDEDVLLGGEPVKITIGKPYELDKVKINEKQKEAQIQMLKNRLMRKKKLLEKPFGTKNDQNTNTFGAIGESKESKDTSALVNDEDRRLATRKTLLDMWNSNPERRFTRSVNDNLWKENKLYKRLTPIKEWKPQDITKLRNKNKGEDCSNWIYKPTNIQFPSKSNIIHKRYKKSPRNLPINYNKKRRHQNSTQRFEPENDADVFLGGEPLKITIGKPYEQDKVKINENQKKAQMQMLKNRLIMKKKLDKTFGATTKNDQNTNSIDADRTLTTRKALNSNPKRRFIRSSRQTNLLKHNEIYKRLTPIKEWKPQDITKLCNKNKGEDCSNWIHKSINIQFPTRTNIINKRYKRYSEAKEIDNEIKPYHEFPRKNRNKWEKVKSNENVIISPIEEEIETTTSLSNLIKSWSFYNVNKLSESVSASANDNKTKENDEQVKVFMFTENNKKHKLESDDDSIFSFNNNTQNSATQLLKTNETKIEKQSNNLHAKTNFFISMFNVFESFFDKVSVRMSDYMKKISETLTH